MALTKTSSLLSIVAPLLLLALCLAVERGQAQATTKLNLCYFFINTINLEPPTGVDYLTFPITDNNNYDDIATAMTPEWRQFLRSELDAAGIPTPQDHLNGFVAVWAAAVILTNTTFQLRKDFPVSMRSAVEFYSPMNCSQLTTKMLDVVLHAVGKAGNRVLMDIDEEIDTVTGHSRLEVYTFGSIEVPVNSTASPTPNPSNEPRSSTASSISSPMQSILNWTAQFLNAH